jgi:hypothetical protein
MNRIFPSFCLQPPLVILGDMDWFSSPRLTVAKVLGPLAPTRQGSARRQLGFASPQQARHDNRPNRVRFLRTDGSPSVAHHPASRRRSNIRIRTPTRSPTRTYTSLVQFTHKRTGVGFQPVIAFGMDVIATGHLELPANHDDTFFESCHV